MGGGATKPFERPLQPGYYSADIVITSVSEAPPHSGSLAFAFTYMKISGVESHEEIVKDFFLGYWFDYPSPMVGTSCNVVYELEDLDGWVGLNCHDEDKQNPLCEGREEFPFKISKDFIPNARKIVSLKCVDGTVIK